MAELLLELFSEEIPARMQSRASEDLARLLGDALRAAGLEFENVRTFATPRRLAAVVEGLPARSPDVKEERKGPRVDAPGQAINGFLKAAGLTSIDQAEIREDKKGDFYVAVIERKGRPTSDVVAGIVPEIVKSFPWPKSMRWGAGKLRWVRPLHSILCVLDGKVVDFEIDGIASGNHTCGHRFMAPKPFAVKNFKDYVAKLKDAFVILDSDERAALISKKARKLAEKRGLALVEDNGLLAENAGLTEWPVPLMGEFDEDFLSVPPEVLATAMKAHQKCFSLEKIIPSPERGGPDRQRRSGKGSAAEAKISILSAQPADLPLAGGGELANRFVLVANLEAEDGGDAIVKGNERVIAARLADAKFFYDQDRKGSLEDWVPKLKEITFHEKLGSQYARVQRVWRLAREIAPLVGADPDLAERAAILAKADLVSGMVGEFPELQGVMGQYYALDQKENPAVAGAVAAHYKPVGASDDVPRDPIAIAVALADKLDALVGFFGNGDAPTGSRDPFALRRACLGIIRIIVEHQLRLGLSNVLAHANLLYANTLYESGIAYFEHFHDEDEETEDSVSYYPVSYQYAGPPNEKQLGGGRDAGIRLIHEGGCLIIFDKKDMFTLPENKDGEFDVRAGFQETVTQLLSFFADRLKVYLRDQGARHDLVDAVFALGGDDLLTIVRRVEALGKFLDTEDGEHLLTGTKRAINILRIEEKKDGRTYDESPDLSLLQQPEEKALAKAVDEVEKAAAAAISKEDFESAMTAMALLRAPVDAFFDNVTVNADDSGLRENRLRLLNRIRATTLAVADFSKIAG